MGGGSSSQKPDQQQLELFSDLAAEYEKLKDEDEQTQFVTLKKMYADRLVGTPTSVEQHVSAHRVEDNKKHGHTHFKTMARLAGKLTRRRKRHFEKGLKRSHLEEHITSKSFNQAHPDLAHDELITRALEETVFGSNEKKAIKAAIRAASDVTLDAGTEIVRQGEDGDTYYVVETGTLDVIVNGEKTATYGPGQHFGELSLIYQDKAEATVSVSDSGKAKVWALTREVFKKVQHQTHGGMIFERAQWLRAVEIFKVLTDAQIMRICYALESKTYKKGETIVTQGSSGDTMFLIHNGSVDESVSGRRHSEAGKETDDSKVVSSLEVGEIFGEHALINRPHHYNATYKAGKEGTELLHMTSTVMDEVLGPLHEVLEEADILNSLLSADTLLSKAHKHHIDARHALHPIIHKMTRTEYKKGDIIIEAGQLPLGMYVLKTGTINGYSTTFSYGDTFGEESLLDTPSAVPSDVVATSGDGDGDNVILYLLPREVAIKFIADHQNRADGNASTCQDRSGIKYEDLENLGLLGEGSFGTVTMVKAILPDGKVESLALKRMGKNHLIEEEMLESTQQEKDILKNIFPHPFVLRLYATYQDRDSVYMLTNLLQGGELYDYLHADGIDKQLTGDEARFYTANIFHGLSHLHEHGFVYRDMKPENVLIGADGYLCIIDLGFAKACPFTMRVDGSAEPVYHEHCYTTCGTPEYMAPEFIFQTGHDKGADYWAMGCLVFEMFHGYTPFVDRIAPDDLSQIFVNIALYNNSNYDLPFKDGFSGTSEAALINAILKPNSVFRLGVVGKGRASFMQHEWFEGLDWDALLNRQIAPPMKPAIKDQFDKSNFGNKSSQLEPDLFDVQMYDTDPFADW